MSADLIQGSAEWLAARLGKVTASRVSDVVATTKSGPAASRANYLAELVAERLTGETAERFQSPEMRRGSEMEADARIAYEFRTDAEVTEVGFLAHPTIADSGASPDGLVGDDGLVEIKCPNTSTHIDTLLRGFIAEKYVIQMQWQMACAGRTWCDFVSFDPRMPESMRLYVRRVERDDKLIESLEAKVKAFLAEVDAKVTELRAIYDAEAA